jgi:aquaporin Z
MSFPLGKRLAAELLGAFALVFAGTGAIVINDVSEGAITHVGISLVFGLVVLALIYALGDVSGCHINPAVTLGFVAARRFPLSEAGPYVTAQISGALLASAMLVAMFPGHPTLGATLPRGPALQSFLLEVFLTWFLMFVVLCVSIGAKEKGTTAGIAIGAVIGLEALFAGPISGASMNPARSIAPAWMSGRIDSLWIYVAGPIVGALIAIPCCRCVQQPGCCSSTPSEVCG